jgi:hypothetical protein
MGFVLAITQPASAKKPALDTVYGTELPMLEGALVEIKSYDAATETYTVQSVTFPGEGEIDVTPEGLQKGVPVIDLKRLSKNPAGIVGQIMKLDADMPSLFKEEKEKRRKDFAKRPKTSMRKTAQK